MINCDNRMNNKMGKTFNSVHDIENWKANMLDHVIDAIAVQHQGNIQKSISAWRWSEALPFPSHNNIRINGGSLTFEVMVAELPVFFSLWYTFGEVRVGVRIPNKLLLPVGALEKKLSIAFDGSPCQKLTAQADSQFFDWIFRDTNDGFASFSAGIKATQDKLTEMAISSKLSDILIHLYMATMNILIEGRNLKVGFKQINMPMQAKYYELDVVGNMTTFEYFLSTRGKAFKSPVKNPSGVGMVYSIMAFRNVVFALQHYEISDSEFSILDCRDITDSASARGY